MTAGQCVVDHFKEWKVVLGAQNLKDTTEPGRVTITSTKAMKHEAYDSQLIANDIAVINLPTDVKLSGKSHLAITKFIYVSNSGEPHSFDNILSLIHEAFLRGHILPDRPEGPVRAL